jgi:uncharacterized protein YkwD
MRGHAATCSTLKTMRLLLFFLLAAVAVPIAARADIRQELLQLVNRERQAAGVPLLRLSPALSQVAQWHAGEIARRGRSLRLPAGTTEAVHERMTRAGYDAHEWTESLQASTQDVETLLRHWRHSDPGTFGRLLDPEFRDLGIGLDRLDGIPLYVFLYAVPEAEHFGRETRGLNDLGQVRAAMLAVVNAERQRAGRRPLTANARLDHAAQRHAADMLARNYFAHESPEGYTVRERAKDAGYDWQAIGENIAEGQTSVAEVMTTWMHSPGHRRNILDRDFKELGVGLAFGKSGSGYRVKWVQAFGARR